MAPGMTWLEVSPQSDSATSLVLYSKEAMLQQNPDMVRHPAIIFATDNAETTWQELKERDVQVDDIQRMPYGTMFNFSEPDGNTYMVRSAPQA